jgi:hypothetical protein|tara:strand:+ start:491 stop:724 length:234 start_codon:yes stop_codon:yes gene_type:complete
MDELMDLLVKDDANASQISDKIKDILFQKSAQEIETIRPNVAASVFDDPTAEIEDDVVDEVDGVEASIEETEDEEEE